MTLLVYITAPHLPVCSDYMTVSCNVDLGEQVGGRLETSSALTYDNLMDCYTSLSVPSDKRVFITFHVRACR